MTDKPTQGGPRFVDRCVIVTGAASGIGRATALLFAGEGAKLVAADIDDGGLSSLADEVAGAGGTITTRHCDVTDVAQIKELMDSAAGDHGGIDVVFNNAGAAGDRAAIDEIDADGWDMTQHLLLRSVAMGIRYAVPHMVGRTGANFVNTASIAAFGPGYSPTAYAVAKAGVLQLTRCAAADLAQHSIRVNAVQPGFIATNIFTSAIGVPPEHLDEAKALISDVAAIAQPVARAGQGDDIANTVAFLASDAAGFINGTAIVVDGGMTIGPRHSWDPNMPRMWSVLDPFVPGDDAS